MADIARWGDLGIRAVARLAGAAFVVAVLGAGSAAPAAGQEHTRADTLRGSIGPERAWWDVTFYDLRVRVMPVDSSIRGRVGIVYRVTEPSAAARPGAGSGDTGARTMQIDLQQPLVVDSVVWRTRVLVHEREGDVVWVDVPDASPVGETDTVVVYYGGHPRVAANPPWDGGFIWARDDRGRPFVATANQGLGASVWWPTKDTQADEPDSQRIAITVPEPLVNVSNGRLRQVVPNGDGTTTFEWFVRNPINNYNVAVNAGHYARFGDVLEGEDGVLTLDYWPLEQNLERAREQFAQTPSVVRCFEHWFGPYPFYEDGLKLVETPHLGMEHQSATAYGNRYRNGYLGRDPSGTGLGLEWDFIIVHELAHEWWGNSLTTADLADMWVHESFGNYAESLYVECLHDPAAGAAYVRGTRPGIRNDRPIIPAYGVNAQGSGDMYSKGGNLLHTIRQVIDDDDRWRAILRGLQSDLRHSIVTGDQVRSYISEHAGIDLDPVFRQYLTTTTIPVLEVRLQSDRLAYRWAEAVDGFDMPVDARLGPDACTRLYPTTAWQTVAHSLPDPAGFDVDQDFYVRV
ncbi:MAG: M1 family metallopeptidase, partial [Gemmatimonadota bacterium]